VACLAVMASLFPGMAWYAAIRHRPGFQNAGWFEQAWLLVTYWSRTAVLGAWTGQFMTRRWRPESSWIDRAGRMLGAFWIVLLVMLYALRAWRAFAR
jgi:hypothetical protein